MKAIAKNLAGFASQPSEIHLVEEVSPTLDGEPGVHSS